MNKEETTLTLTSSPTQVTGPVTVSAVLKEDGITPIAGRTVAFTAGTAAGSGVTNASGVATAILTLTPGQYTLTASFAGDSFYVPAMANTQTLYSYQATSFVIWGGNNPSLAQAVPLGQDFNFWGAQWWKQVAAGDYQSNASFKGYANAVSSAGWTSDPGNSSSPPATVASYIGVIVATHAAKNGSVESGNIAEIVVLRVDSPATYAPDPGHPGSGVVVAVAQQ